jgi:rare lipoprotein A
MSRNPHRDAGGSLKYILSASLASAAARRPPSTQFGRAASFYFKRFSGLLLSAFCVLCISLSSGCAARNPVAGRQPPPAQPSPTPSETAEKAKRSTDVPPQPAPGPARRGNKPIALPPPAGYTEEGNASWYGEPFNGRRASNGEIYDMYKLTAAHRTLPFDTVVRVTNLNNGKTTSVRITDRGPFVENRIIDLSLAAAREIDSIGAGVVPVRLEIVSGSVDPESGFFTVQVGAFRDPANANRLRDRLSGSHSPIFIQQYDSADGLYYRVRVGKVSGEDAARQFGEQLRVREGFTPFVVRLDEGAASGGNR